MTPTSHFFPQFSLLRLLATACAGFVLLIAFGLLAPKWVISLGTLALANGLVSLGILVMMRSGVVPFGQGLVFAAGGYAALLGMLSSCAPGVSVLNIDNGYGAAMFAARLLRGGD